MRGVRLACVLALGVAACGQTATPGGSASARATTDDPALARVGDAEILRSQVAAAMRATGKDERSALDDLIHFELLARAAAATIAPADPNVREAVEAMMVQRLVEKELEPHLGKGDIPDDVLQGIYEKARKVFVHPRLVNVAMLNVYTGARMKPEPRARASATAHALDALVRTSNHHTADELEALASAPAWRDRKVVFERVWQAIDDPFPVEVGREVQRLAHPGDVTPL